MDGGVGRGGVETQSWLTLLMFGFCHPHHRLPISVFHLLTVLSWFCLALHCSRTCAQQVLASLKGANSVVCTLVAFASHLRAYLSTLFSPTTLVSLYFTYIFCFGTGFFSPSFTCYASLTMRRYKKLLAINQLSLFNYLAHFAIYPATGMCGWILEKLVLNLKTHPTLHFKLGKL